MNIVIEAHAHKLATLDCNLNTTSCHLYLDNCHFPVNIQDKILDSVSKLQVVSVENIAQIIDHCYD